MLNRPFDRRVDFVEFSRFNRTHYRVQMHIPLKNTLGGMLLFIRTYRLSGLF